MYIYIYTHTHTQIKRDGNTALHETAAMCKLLQDSLHISMYMYTHKHIPMYIYIHTYLNRDGNTALHEAAARNYVQVATRLIANGMLEIDRVNTLGRTALHTAVSNRHLTMVHDMFVHVYIYRCI